MIEFARLFVLLCVLGGIQSGPGVLAQDGEKFSNPDALEKIESLVSGLNESLHETKKDLQEVRLCLNQTKKELGEVQSEKAALEAQLLETRNELAVTKSLHQQKIAELRATLDSSRKEMKQGLKEVKRNRADFEIKLKRVKRKVRDLKDEELQRQLNELNRDLSEVTQDLRRLEDENLPRRVSELATDYNRVVTKVATAEYRHNSTIINLRNELHQVKSEAQRLENKLEGALSTLPDEQLADRVQELADQYNSLQVKLAEVEVGEEEWESRIAMSRALIGVKSSLSNVYSLLSNMGVSIEQGLNATKANFSKMEHEVEVVEKELCEKVQNLSAQVEDIQQQSAQSVADLNQTIYEATTAASQQQESTERLRRGLNWQNDTVTRLSGRVAQQSITNDRLQQRVAEQESNISRLSSNIQMQVRTIEYLTSEVTEQGARIAHLKHDLEENTIDVRNLSEVQYQMRRELSNDFTQLLKCYQPKATPTSCKELHQCDPTTPSGHYNINTPQGVKRVYCEMEANNCGDVAGGWMRVAHINMTDSRHTCPQGLRYIEHLSKRMCTHSKSVGARGCSSITFPHHGLPYTKVCGRARGYQFGNTQSFKGYDNYRQSLEGHYVQGLSVTHGSPRNHIWTFAAGVSKDGPYWAHNCPCARYNHKAAPPFVGENYYCESGSEVPSFVHPAQWYLDDPLWDSEGCPDGSTCCDRGGPWFNTTLSQEVSNDIEVRWCFNGKRGEDYGVDQLEIYVH